MKDGIIIQARTGSTRLKNKILLPFYCDKSILDILIEKIISLHGKDKKIILATTLSSQDDVLEEKSKIYGINCFRGNEKDVLLRFIGAAKKYDIERFIRVCSDNPFLDVNSFGLFFDYHNSIGSDYLSYQFSDGKPVILSHLGLFSELVLTKALLKVDTLTEQLSYREHVTNYIYTHSHQFNVKFLTLPEEIDSRKEFRFTLDTWDDFILLQEIYKIYYEITDGSYSSLFDLIDNNLEYKKRMKLNIENNQK